MCYFDIYCENVFVARVTEMSAFIWAIIHRFEILKKANFSVTKTLVEKFCKVTSEIYNTNGKDKNAILYIVRK